MAAESRHRTLLRDPHHAQIVSRLARHLDPDVFERCIADLWRGRFPTLVPVTGGSDQGFDGAIADGEGEPYQLVCTTSASFSKVKANLMGSLDTARREGRLRHKAAFATSFALTPAQRFDLLDATRAFGVTLIDIADREALADLLYRDRRWCQKLLQLSGQPRALSAVPEGSRPFPAIDPVGRDRDLDWLRATAGDRILAGQPGSGKTILLRQLVRKRAGFFLASDAADAIANDLRELEPPAIFVDDAHVHSERLALLLRLREEIGHRFSIVATSWPGDIDALADRLGELPRGQIRSLEPLTRDEIVQVYHRLGVRASDAVMRVLVDQAMNKPGLAATLAQAWLSGEWADVATGEALCRRVLSSLGRRTAPDPTLSLATLALGGDGGMSLETAAGYLETSLAGLRRELSAIHDAGIVQQTDSRNLAVVPRDLRSALIRRVFFPAPHPSSLSGLPCERLLDDPSRLPDTTLELIRAAHRHAAVPRPVIEKLILRADETAAWRMREMWRGYALLGPSEAAWVLERYPRDVVDVAKATLAHAAEPTVWQLLERTRTAEGLLHNQPDHPLRILQDWMREFPTDDPQMPLKRRALVVRLARRLIASEPGNDRDIAIHAMTLTLDPTLEGMSQDPGLGAAFSLFFGLLPSDALRAMVPLWREVHDAIGTIDALTWRRLTSALWSWAHPEMAAHGNLDADQRRAAMAFVAAVAADLRPAAADRPGLARALDRVARWVGPGLSLDRDPVFELLFPEHESSFEAESSARERCKVAIASLAARWSERPPTEVIADLQRYLSEERFLGPGHADLTCLLCADLASAVTCPQLWLGALLDGRVGAPQLRPFLAKCVRERREGWEGWLARCFEAGDLRWAAIEELLTMADPPCALADHAIADAGRFPQLIETLCSNRRVPQPQLKALLGSLDAIVSLAAAAGEWDAEPQHRVRRDISEDWRRAILRLDSQALLAIRGAPMLEFWLGEILSADTDLAVEWLCARLREPNRGPLDLDGPTGEAIDALSADQRMGVLAALSLDVQAPDLVRRLVRRDVQVYRRLLAMERLTPLHLEPLEGLPDNDWVPLAVEALQASHSPAEVAEATISGLHLIVGRAGGQLWEQYLKAFSRLEESASPDLQCVARAGREFAQERLEAARRRARSLEVVGH